jgi:DNA (cytosine-5)-methyltransferase 1
MPIPVIDLFAGPGGLGEGFSSLLDSKGGRVFKIKLSIEKDEPAHRTLELRAFFREFPVGEVPQDYYDYLAHKISLEDLYSRHPRQAERAWLEAWHAELGGKETSDGEIDERIELALGTNTRNWVLIGGPPCQAYSLVGRSRIIGGEGIEKYEEDPRHDLYRQYLRILAVHRPPIFVMENVKGLLSATVKKAHIFEQILADLKRPPLVSGRVQKDNLEYQLFPLVANRGEVSGRFEPEDFVIRSEEFGIPQSRHRIIILGIRSDWPRKPDLLNPEKTQIAIEQAIGDLPKLRSGLSKEPDSTQEWHNAICGLVKAKWFLNGEMDEGLRKALAIAVMRIGADLSRGSEFVTTNAKPECHKDWFADAKLNGVCNHDTRSHIRSDLHRYFFAAVFARKNGRSPLLDDFPTALLPEHENVPRQQNLWVDSSGSGSRPNV